MEIIRAHSGKTVNRIVNHAQVKPWFVGDTRLIDLSRMAADPRCRILIGSPDEFGAQIAWQILDGVWEFHTAVLPEGRGEWTVDFCAAATRYMFCTTDAIELITRIPQGSLGALTLARRFGLQPRWACPECRFRGKLVPYGVWSLTLFDWLPAEAAARDAVIEDMRRFGAETKAANWEARWRLLSGPGVN